MNALSFSSHIRAPLTSVTSQTNHRSLLNPHRPLPTPRTSLLTAPRAPRITHASRPSGAQHPIVHSRGLGVHRAGAYLALRSHHRGDSSAARHPPPPHGRAQRAIPPGESSRSSNANRAAPDPAPLCCSALLLPPLVMPASTGSCLRPPSRAFPLPSLANASHGCAPAVLHGLRLLACAGGGQAQEG